MSDNSTAEHETIIYHSEDILLFHCFVPFTFVRGTQTPV